MRPEIPEALEASRLVAIMRRTDASLAVSSVVALHPHLADGEAVAKLNIPTVGFSAIVTEGADSGLLSSGPGHDHRTAYPGEGGVVVIGNHNGLSFSWNGINPGDPVVLEMTYGRYRYTVTKRYSVDGDDTTVISQPRSSETLLLTSSATANTTSAVAPRAIMRSFSIEGLRWRE